MTHDANRRVLARLPSGVEVATTVHRYVGRADGPRLYVQAAQHGREVNGAEVLRRFHDRLDTDALRGSVVAVPVADPLTFDRGSYTTPEALDSVNANMNRVWPGDAEGTLHERMASSLWPDVTTADAVVDLHTGSPNMLPHTVFMEGDAPSRALAEAFGTDLLLSEAADEDADAEWHDRGFAGKLRVAATNEGIPTITPELAHHSALVEDAIETGVDGLLDVLRHLDMLPGEPSPNDPDLCRNHLGRVTATDAGLFRPHPDRELGERVDPGDPLGTLYDPTSYETLQEAEVDREGILYSLRQAATTHAGATLGSVALPRE